LLYYLIANLAAYTQGSERRRFPRILQIIGVLGCGTLVLTLPLRAVLTGALVYVLGICYRAFDVDQREEPRPYRRAVGRRRRSSNIVRLVPNSLLIVHVDVAVVPDQLQGFLDATEENARDSRKEHGVVRFDVLHDREDPIMSSLWRSTKMRRLRDT
jgi:hypothetical protein